MQVVASVSYADLHPEIVFQKYGFMERLIVANHPGGDGGKQPEHGSA